MKSCRFLWYPLWVHDCQWQLSLHHIFVHLTFYWANRYFITHSFCIDDSTRWLSLPPSLGSALPVTQHSMHKINWTLADRNLDAEKHSLRFVTLYVILQKYQLFLVGSAVLIIVALTNWWGWRLFTSTSDSSVNGFSVKTWYPPKTVSSSLFKFCITGFIHYFITNNWTTLFAVIFIDLF